MSRRDEIYERELVNPFRLLFVDFSKRGVLANQPAHRTVFAAYLRLKTCNMDAVCTYYRPRCNLLISWPLTRWR